MKDPHDADFEEASSSLIAGLKSCRSVVESYRAMLSAEKSDEQASVRSDDLGEARGPSDAPAL